MSYSSNNAQVTILEKRWDEDRLTGSKHEKRLDGGFTGIGSSKCQAAERIASRVKFMLEDFNSVSKVGFHEKTFENNDLKNSSSRVTKLTHDSRATVDQVLDKRTVLLLIKLFRRGVFNYIYGCVSAGKEANVYLGSTGDLVKHSDVENTHIHTALKVFRTSILSFKDRARYVQGEFRFRTGYMGSRNPRKMVQQWAEKEYRNLRRMICKGIRCPIPIDLRGHVIAMSFLGTNNATASPQLKDLTRLRPKLNSGFWIRLYVEAIVILRLLFHECKLVHGDFSEFNILYHKGHCYVIDVGQSVEHDHPSALEFLKRDCINVNRFFKKLIFRSEENSHESDSENKNDGSFKDIIEDNDEDHSSATGFSENDNFNSFSDSNVLNINNNHMFQYAEESLQLENFGVQNFIYETLDDVVNLCYGGTVPDIKVLSTEKLFNYITQETLDLVISNCSDARNDLEPVLESNDTAASQMWPEFDKPEKVDIRCFELMSDSGDFLLYEKKVSQGLITMLQTIKNQRLQFNSLCVKTLSILIKETKKTQQAQFDITKENVFISNWIPSDLNQVLGYKQLETLLDTHNRGEETMYDLFLVPKATDIELNSETASETEADLVDEESTNGKKFSGTHYIDKLKHNSKIPEGMDPKEWKRKVKEEARERRQKKIPKYIKRKKNRSRQHKRN